MEKEKIIYRSANDKTDEQTSLYSETHKIPHRYLAYRDIPTFVQKFVKGKKALDYGCGTGASTSFLYELGFDVIGVDISSSMLKRAKESFEYIKFCNFADSHSISDFDLVFSSFVLFELGNTRDIIEYLNNVRSFLKKGGIFIGITGSEELYSPLRTWMTFDANFKENLNLQSGDTAKLLLKNPRMEFEDYFWKEQDYLYCFKKVGFEIEQIHYPFGCRKEPYAWKDEISYSPFVIFIAKNH